MDNPDDDPPNHKLDAMLEVMGHVAAIKSILTPLLILEEQRESKARRRAVASAQRSAPLLTQESA